MKKLNKRKTLTRLCTFLVSGDMRVMVILMVSEFQSGGRKIIRFSINIGFGIFGREKIEKKERF